MRNASFIQAAFRTPDMETFIKELSGEKKVLLRTKKNKGLPVWAKAAIPAACVLLIAGGVLLAVKLRNKPAAAPTTDSLAEELTIVPSLINLQSAEAERKLTQSELLFEIAGKEINDEKDADTVLSQNTETGSFVPKNTVVGVILSAKSGLITMPNFLGLDGNTCISAAENLGFSYSVKEAYSRSVEKGCVISQSITPYQEIRVDQRLELIISLGRDPADDIQDHTVSVENHVGKTYDQVLSAASQQGTPVKVAKKVYDDTKPEGTVINQYPPANSRQSSADSVQVEVTTANKDVILPDMTLLEQKRASDILTLFGVVVEIKSVDNERIAAGLVAAQEPAPGEHTEVGKTVTLSVSTGKPEVSMPDVVGKTADEAVKAVTDAGLSPKLAYAADGSKPDGEVIAQSIPAGSGVTKGMSILLTVNASDHLAEIPDVRKMTAEEAKKAIEDAGFVMKIYVDDEHQVTEGRVFTQSPNAGQSAEKGSEITVLLSEALISEDSESSGEDSLTETIIPDLVLTPESVKLKKGEQFTLKIELINMDNPDSLQYQFEIGEVLREVSFDRDTCEITFIAEDTGTEFVTVSCGDVEHLCYVDVSE